LCAAGSSRGSALRAADAPAVRRVALLMALTWGAMRGSEYLLVPFVRSQFGWTDGAVGLFSTACAAATVAGNLLLAVTPLRRLPAVGVCAIGAGLSALGCGLYALSGRGRPALFWAGGLAYSIATFLSPLLRSMLSCHIKPSAQARALGAAAAFESACAVVAPLVFGPLVRALEARGMEPASYLLASALFAGLLPILACHGHDEGVCRPASRCGDGGGGRHRAERGGDGGRHRGDVERARSLLPPELSEPLVSAIAQSAESESAGSDSAGSRRSEHQVSLSDRQSVSDDGDELKRAELERDPGGGEEGVRGQSAGGRRSA
jgi:hypothetical protein